MARTVKLSKLMKMIVVATGVVLGGTSLSTAALARGGGFGGGHFGGGGHLGWRPFCGWRPLWRGPHLRRFPRRS